MKQWFKRITGIEAEEQRLAEEKARLEAEAQAEKERLESEEMELLKKKDPKAYATRRKEPWINVLDVKVNENNIRNGFFELDWNEYFIKQLLEAGYGSDGDLEEEIVDRWFKDIVSQMLMEEGLDASRGAGYINVIPIDQGKSEVS